jgi:hypothetical protein
METSVTTEALLRLSATVADLFPTHFKRDRGALGPRQVFMTLLAMHAFGDRSYRQSLSAVRASCERWLGAWVLPSDSAFSQARRKLPGELLRSGFQRIRQEFARARSCPREVFCGLRLVAVDGTRLTLPVDDELKKVFGCPLNQAREPAACPQAGLVVLWDVSANQPIAWKLDSYKMSERAAAIELLEHLQPGEVLLADRGYPGTEFFQAVLARKAHFIIRMNTTSVAKTREFKEFLASGAHDHVVDLTLPTPSQDDDAPRTIRVRFIVDPQRPECVLATSLVDADTYPAAQILTAYTSRWNIETAFRESKQWHGLEDFSARYSDGIHQEVAAIMTLHYLLAELEVDLRQRINDDIEQGRLPAEAATNIPYTFNRPYIAFACAHLLVIATSEPEKLQENWQFYLTQIWRAKARKRPGRSAPRRAKSPRSITRATRPRRRKN